MFHVCFRFSPLTFRIYTKTFESLSHNNFNHFFMLFFGFSPRAVKKRKKKASKKSVGKFISDVFFSRS